MSPYIKLLRSAFQKYAYDKSYALFTSKICRSGAVGLVWLKRLTGVEANVLSHSKNLTSLWIGHQSALPRTSLLEAHFCSALLYKMPKSGKQWHLLFLLSRTLLRGTLILSSQSFAAYLVDLKKKKLFLPESHCEVAAKQYLVSDGNTSWVVFNYSVASCLTDLFRSIPVNVLASYSSTPRQKHV